MLQPPRPLPKPLDFSKPRKSQRAAFALRRPGRITDGVMRVALRGKSLGNRDPGPGRAFLEGGQPGCQHAPSPQTPGPRTIMLLGGWVRQTLVTIETAAGVMG